MATRPWLPTDFTSVTLEGWYFLRDATGALVDGAKVVQSAGAVSQWNDASGKGRTLFNSTANKPSYSATGLDGSSRPAVTTTSSVQGFLTNTGMAYPAGQILGAFSVLKINANGRGVAFVDAGSGSVDYGNNGIIPLYIDGNIQFYHNGSQSVPSVTGAPSLIEGYAISATSGVASVNAGTPSGAVATNMSGITLDRMGVLSHAHGGGLGEGALAALSEVVVIAGPPSTADLQKLEGYLAWNNGTQGSLPTGHPYKAAAPTVTTADPGPAAARRRPLILIAS